MRIQDRNYQQGNLFQSREYLEDTLKIMDEIENKTKTSVRNRIIYKDKI